MLFNIIAIIKNNLIFLNYFLTFLQASHLNIYILFKSFNINYNYNNNNNLSIILMHISIKIILFV